MKKLAIVALALMAVGFFMMLIGFMIGVTPLYFDSTGMHRRTLQPDLENFTDSYAKVATVTLQCAAEDVSIISGDRFGYTITGNYSRPYETSLTNDSLVITQNYDAGWFDIGWGSMVMFGNGFNSLPRVTIYIPEDMTIRDLNVDIVSGDIWIESVEVDRFTLNGASGNISTSYLTVNESLNANLVSGDVYLAGDLRGNIHLSGASGNIRMEIDGRADEYSWQIDAVSGGISVSDPSGSLPTNARAIAPPSIPPAPPAPPMPPGSNGNGSVDTTPSVEVEPARRPSGPNSILIDAISGDISLFFLR